MRLLLIEEDARHCARIRERLNAWRPQAQLIVHSPVRAGALAPEFLAQGFDAVLLADEWPGGRGLSWARELAGRAGFAPLVLLCGGSDPTVARDAIALGAYALHRDELERDAFTHVLTAAERRQAYARAVWRTSHAGRETQRFGDAFIRGYRCIRRLATGATTDLYVGESEARRYPGGAQGGTRPPGRADAARSMPSGASCRSTRSYSASTAPRWCVSTIWV